MRNISTAQQKIIENEHYRVEHRVFVEKENGTFQNMSELEGYDWLTNINWSANIDTITKQATVQVDRNIYRFNASPLVEESKINIDGTTFKPLLEVGRRIYVESAIVPVNQQATTSDWFEVFRGYIQDIDLSSNPVQITIYDRSGRLQTFIEKERTYGAENGSVLAEDVIQSILDDKFTAGKFDLYTPVSTGFAITPYQQKKEPIISAADNIVKNFGWNLEYRWDNSTDQFRFTLYEPDRDKTTPDYTFEADEYFNVQKLSLSLENIRNKIKGTFTNSSTGERESVTVSDTASIETYGKLEGDDGNTIFVPRFMEITEASTSQIDTTQEMTDLLNNVLNDLKQPKATLQITVDYFPFIQINDLIRLKANNIHFDTDQDLAVISYNHNLKNNETTLTLRGKPAGAYDQWLVRDSRPGIAPTSKFPDAPTISISTGLETNKEFITAYADISLAQDGKANQYQIRYRQVGETEWEKFTTKEDTVRLGNLITNVDYEIEAKAILLAGGIANLDFISQAGANSFTTPADNQAPDQPVIDNVESKIRGIKIQLEENTEKDLAGYEIHLGFENDFEVNRTRSEIDFLRVANLTADATSGDTSLTVDDASYYESGKVLRLIDSVSEEEITVDSISSDGNTINLVSSISNSYSTANNALVQNFKDDNTTESKIIKVAREGDQEIQVGDGTLDSLIGSQITIEGKEGAEIIELVSKTDVSSPGDDYDFISLNSSLNHTYTSDATTYKTLKSKGDQTYFEINNLEQAEQYYIKVFAYDNSGNFSTPAPIDVFTGKINKDDFDELVFESFRESFRKQKLNDNLWKTEGTGTIGFSIGSIQISDDSIISYNNLYNENNSIVVSFRYKLDVQDQAQAGLAFAPGYISAGQDPEALVISNSTDVFFLTQPSGPNAFDIYQQTTTLSIDVAQYHDYEIVATETDILLFVDDVLEAKHSNFTAALNTSETYPVSAYFEAGPAVQMTVDNCYFRTKE